MQDPSLSNRAPPEPARSTSRRLRR
jgi:hypothetical protein